MKSITIHNLDDRTAELIRQEADRKGLSLNKTIKFLLKKALGIKVTSANDKRAEFADLFGVWTIEDEKQFRTHINDLDKIDPKV